MYTDITLVTPGQQPFRQSTQLASISRFLSEAHVALGFSDL